MALKESDPIPSLDTNENPKPNSEKLSDAEREAFRLAIRKGMEEGFREGFKPLADFANQIKETMEGINNPTESPEGRSDE